MSEDKRRTRQLIQSIRATRKCVVVVFMKHMRSKVNVYMGDIRLYRDWVLTRSTHNPIVMLIHVYFML